MSKSDPDELDVAGVDTCLGCSPAPAPSTSPSRARSTPPPSATTTSPAPMSALCALPFDVFLALAGAMHDNDVLALSVTCRAMWAYAVGPPLSLRPWARPSLLTIHLPRPPFPLGYLLSIPSSPCLNVEKLAAPAPLYPAADMRSPQLTAERVLAHPPLHLPAAPPRGPTALPLAPLLRPQVPPRVLVGPARRASPRRRGGGYPDSGVYGGRGGCRPAGGRDVPVSGVHGGMMGGA